MSRAVSLYCRTCRVAEPYFRRNHGDAKMAAMWAARNELLDLADQVAAMDLQWPFEIDLKIPFDFIRAHKDHDVAPRDEYGAFSDLCGERVACGGCGATKWCGLAKGHAPPHLPRAA